MTITAADLGFRQTERMTDNPDGGGRVTAVEIVSGRENQIFDDLSDVDRAAGDVSIRKVGAVVMSDDTDKYLDAGIVVFAAPADPAVSVVAYSTGDLYDTRGTFKAQLESGVTAGARYNGWLWGSHEIGQRAITIWQLPAAALPGVGQRLMLVSYASGVVEHSQILWITRVIEELITLSDGTGSFIIRSVVCEIADRLTARYVGTEPGRVTPSAASAAIFNTRYNTESVTLVGVQSLTEDVALGDYSVRVPSLYAPLIPTSFAETPLADVTAGGAVATLIPAFAPTPNPFPEILISTTLPVVKTGGSWFIGSPVYPGTLKITIGLSEITDSAGALKLAGSPIGTIDYGNGVCNFAAGTPDFRVVSKTLSCRPAALATRVGDTASQQVTGANRGFVWVLTLSPIPAPGTLRVSYRANNEWYELADNVSGRLSGADSSYGSGTISYLTGTAVITTGAMPDIESEIIYTWGTPVSYRSLGSRTTIPGPKITGTTAHTGIAPGTFIITWLDGEYLQTMEDNGNGVLIPSNDSSLSEGGVRYATGEWWILPFFAPAMGTEFTIEYDHGAPVSETFSHPAREQDATLRIVLAQAPRPGSIEVIWNTIIIEYSPETLSIVRPDPLQIARDDGEGNLPISGGTTGTVTYATRVVQWLPDVTLSIPHETWRPGVLLSTEPGPDPSHPIDVYSRIFNGWEYIDTGSSYPTDESGQVTIRYRVSDGDTTASETKTLDMLTLDCTQGYAEKITAGSLRLNFAGSIYVDRAGGIYRNPAADTGVGTLCGTLDPSTGMVRLTQWTAGGNGLIATILAMTTEIGVQPVDRVVFRTPISPIKPQTFQIRWQDLAGNSYSKTPNGAGLSFDNDAEIRIDYTRGTVQARFGRWRLQSDLTAQALAAPWYSSGAFVERNGGSYIWQSTMVDASTIIHNSVATVMLPPDSQLLGLDAARMPPDGKALIYRVGMLALVHHTAHQHLPIINPGQIIDCGRPRLYRVSIDDALGNRLSQDGYTLNRITGFVTIADPFDMQGFTPPWTVSNTVADLGRIRDTDINGTLTLVRALSHEYPASESKVSGMLYIGTLQARVSNLFAQTTWTNQWSDTLIGQEPLAQFNSVSFPIQVKNRGAYSDRFLVQFTSALEFRVIGENLGVIAVGNIETDCTPINLLTGLPFFTIPWRAWGLGWAVGNCLRFNLVGAIYPVHLVRAVQPSEPTGDIDSVELMLVGNIDA